MVDIVQLRAVTAIAEHGSITAGARALGMSQPGLSRLVERLEDEFDATLFTRGRTGAALTPEGQKLLEFASSSLAEYELLQAAVSGKRRQDDGATEVLRVVASTTPGEYLLPHLAGGFAHAEQNVVVDSLVTDFAAHALLMTGGYDVGSHQ